MILADFYLKMAEAAWCIVSGIYGKKLIIITRNAGFWLDAGKVAKRLFGKLDSAGGHKSAARVEIPISALPDETENSSKISAYVADKIKKH